MAGDDARDPLSYTLPGHAVRAVSDMWTPLRPIDEGVNPLQELLERLGGLNRAGSGRY